MPHSFKITSAKGGQFVAKFVYNAETIFWSENYAGKDSAKNAIASLKKNAPGAAVVDTSKGEDGGKGYRFEIAASKDGQHFVRFVASNNETMVRTETYKSKSSAKNAIESLKKRAAATPIVDEA
ncbi:YegP family protein [Devosia sp. CN2-171]|uniref:YegP family protein n=1 Tax=Devosia sp. CN2-171 TaxID=3400909 RepID=UPI003BF879FE